jgi:hypothetical protein
MTMSGKELPPEPKISWLNDAIWWLHGWITWPYYARKLKRAGFRRTGWMTWECSRGRVSEDG